MPTAYRLGVMGDALWVLGGDPELTVVPLGETGLPGAPLPIQRTAPLRDAAWDGEHLWTVEPLDTRVRRDTGPLRTVGTKDGVPTLAPTKRARPCWAGSWPRASIRRWTPR